MNTPKWISLLLLFLCFTTFSQSPPLRLSYGAPASDWMTEALPIGNGYMGAMFYGGVDQERIQVNEETLWSGGPGEWGEYNGGNRPDAHQHLAEVRRLLDAGDYKAAHRLANKELTGRIKGTNSAGGWVGYGSYQNLGELQVSIESSDEVVDYQRNLDIEKAIGTVTYKQGKVTHNRTYFASYPKRTMVFRFENDARKGTDYVLDFISDHPGSDRLSSNTWTYDGIVSNNGMKFQAMMKIKTDGEVKMMTDKVSVEGAKSLTIYFTSATDYLNDYPTYTGRDYKSLNKQVCLKLEGTEYFELMEEHIQDYQRLFNRVSLSLGGQVSGEEDLKDLLNSYAKGESNLGLETLLFQYGRYLLISSSRPGSMPANLQGKWNNSNNPPWASDYHANINIQMIYWPAEVTNLAECHEPLIEYIDKLREPGRQSARDHFGADGWIVNTMNNPFGFTAPGWSFPWGFFPGGAAWYARHAWEHYQYSNDLDYLKGSAYPIMKEAAEFWLDYLTQDKEGFWVSSPSYSPEHGGISTGAYMDIQIVWDLLSNLQAAHDAMGIENDFTSEVDAVKAKMLPLRIGKWGQLQEWKEDLDDPKNRHRHVSHLYALYPGYQIDQRQTPEYAQAARTSLDARGDDGTGWSLGWKINFWSRLEDGDRAYKLLRRALQITGTKGVEMNDGGGVYSNLLSAHPPFQLDGNMGATAGVAEMLVQSHGESVRILPALPTAWAEGEVKGLRARGGLTVDIKWQAGALDAANITADREGVYTIEYKQTKKEIQLKSGERRTLNFN